MAFQIMTHKEIKNSFNIRRGATSRFLLPLLVVLDLSASCAVILENELFLMKKLCEELTARDNLAEPFLILSVIQDGTETADKQDEASEARIVYSGYLKDFDINAFEANADHCRGNTPLVNVFNASLKYLNKFIETLDNATPRPTIPHTMPTVLFITDYLDNTASESEIDEVVSTICDDVDNCRKMVLEFKLTEEQQGRLKNAPAEPVTFGGFICRYDNEEILNFVTALKMSSSTVTTEGEIASVPRSDIIAYNKMLMRAMYNRMHTLWARENN